MNKSNLNITLGRVIKKIFIYAALALAAFISLLPYYWMVSTAFKTESNIFRLPIQWFPNPINWMSFVNGWHAQNFPRYFFNSFFVSIAITLGTLVFASLAGYSLAKFRYPGRNLFFLIILSTMMLPLEVTMVPLFLLIKNFEWQNTYQGLIIPFLVEGFGVFLMR
ncbi:MAG: carbohydrate ABC transporter permease, partial [Chloroflexota bacterium]